MRGLKSSPKTRKEREIWEACKTLEAEKRPLTYLAIGEQLVQLGYKRGSNSDIRRYLKTWKKNQSVEAPALPDPVLDEKVSVPLFKSELPALTLAEVEKSSLLPFLLFYQHHIEQFDRLLHVIDLLKKENKLLRTKLALVPAQERVNRKPNHAKPRIVLPALLGEEC